MNSGESGGETTKEGRGREEERKNGFSLSGADLGVVQYALLLLSCDESIVRERTVEEEGAKVRIEKNHETILSQRDIPPSRHSSARNSS